MLNAFKIWIGWDISEIGAWDVARFSMQQHSSVTLDVFPLGMEVLRATGLYGRSTVRRANQLWDIPSGAPMSTGHALARFFIPFLAKGSDWVLFTDGDILVRRDIAELFRLADPRYAVMTVQHDYRPIKLMKKHSSWQQPYARKNWSSVMLWNTQHPGHQRLTLEMLNTVPGRDLHRFCWLKDDELGALPEAWNWLAGHSSMDIDPAIVHFTEGLPTLAAHAQSPFAEEWHRAALELRQQKAVHA